MKLRTGMRKQSEWIFPIKNIDVLLFGFSILIGSLLFNSSNAFAYTQRTAPPESSNSWYYSSANPFYAAPGLASKGKQEGGSYVIENCTWHAWGRAAEVPGSAPKIGSGTPTAMWNYVRNNRTYETGSTPKPGSLVIGTSNGSGHVAFVEYVRMALRMFPNPGLKGVQLGQGFPIYIFIRDQ